MLHYSCDVCKRPIDPQRDIRHVVKIEVFPAVDDVPASACGDDADHLDAMQEMLERIGDGEDADAFDDGARSMRFDLCEHCRQRFVGNPLGINPGKRLDFSNN